jgi:CBS domain-containing protein
MAATVRDVMTPKPLTLDARTSLESAAKVMRDHDVGAVLVAHEGILHGVLTDRDIVVRAIASGRHPAATFAMEACSTDVETIPATDSPDRAAELMLERELRRLPVVDDGKLVGIVTLTDLAPYEGPRSRLAGIATGRDHR